MAVSGVKNSTVLRNIFQRSACSDGSCGSGIGSLLGGQSGNGMNAFAMMGILGLMGQGGGCQGGQNNIGSQIMKALMPMLMMLMMLNFMGGNQQSGCSNSGQCSCG